MLTGTELWQTSVEALHAPLQMVNESRSMLTKINFPREALILAAVGQVLFNFAIRALLLVAVMAWYQVPPTAGLTLGLAALHAHFKDVRELLNSVLQLLMFMTPIFYTIGALKDHPELQFAMRLNALTIVVENARLTVMRDQPPEWLWLGIVTGVSVVLMQLGYAWFMKTKRGFADVL